MFTRRTASDLLAHFAAGAPLAALAGHLGFSARPLPLDESLAHSLGIPWAGAPPLLMLGDGARRALLMAAPPREPLRPFVAKIAQRLATQSPHQLWLLMVARAGGGEGAIAAWHADGTRVRVSALLFDSARVLESDIETLLALQAAAGGQDTLSHARWCEIMGRDALSHRFYRALERAIVALGEGARGSAPSEARRELALLTASRLLFLSFLQARGWLDGDADFLVRHFDAALVKGGDTHRRFLEPLFFGTLNTPVSRRAAAARMFGRVPFLNGGLFARSAVEARYRTVRFRDDEVGALFDDVLTRYRFTAREEQREWSEAAIDPEMLGRAFESLMASRERRDSGAYYTPQDLVARVTDAALEHALQPLGTDGEVRHLRTDPATVSSADAMHLRDRLSTIRVLDPACGSGAFLVHALERIARLMRACGDQRSRADVRRAVLTRSIFGVDVNPMAVWLCELRLWLSGMIDLDVDDPLGVPPLPNLDRNVRVGDALGGGTFDDRTGLGPTGALRLPASVAALRARYARATGPRKLSLARELDGAERRAALADLEGRIVKTKLLRRELLVAARGRDLFGRRRGALGGERVRLEELRTRLRSLGASRRSLERGGALPFRFASHFADVAADGGFDIGVGNPPWVRLHRNAADRREGLKAEFRVYRDAAWKRGATDAGAGAGFAAQVDLAALFAERSMDLTRPGGTMALLLPIKLWRSLAGGGVRRLLGDDHDLCLLEDWSDAPAAFDAAVYPSLVVARKRVRGAVAQPNVTLQVAVHRCELAITWPLPRASLALDASPGAPWLLLPPQARVAFDRLANAGPPLAESGLGRPTLGVKCGLNAAFLVQCVATGGHSARVEVGGHRDRVEVGGHGARVESGGHGARVESDGREGLIEDQLLRPVLRGEQARRWSPTPSSERIIWTHGADARALRTLPPLAARWLGHWRGALSRRTDLRGGAPWWSLHRIEGAVSERPRVVWADMSRGPRACVLAGRSPWIPLNSCYVVSCRDDVDAAALAALFNSPLAGSWLDAVAEPARGGFRRYLGWTVARLPIPADWARARDILAPLGARGVSGEAVGDDELLEASIAAYRIRASAARALVEWTWR
ncbi:MAG: N-6 DNA methylase [Gemmatimonadaceae bacterium]|nr:N-6 DNA methylase [Gemmatimonadaceae bacterium]